MIRSKKYNVVVTILILIISVVVGLSAGMSKISSPNIDSTNPDSVVDLPDDLVIDDGSDDEISSNVPPASAGAFERLAYAFDILNNGAGYTAYYSQSIFTMGQDQKVTIKRYRGGGKNLTEEWYAIDFSVGKNEFKMFYSDGTNMKIKLIDNKTDQSYSKLEYNPSAGSTQDLTVHDYTVVQKRTPINTFFTTVNKDTAILDKYDTKSDDKNYIIRVKIAKENIDAEYLNAFYANGVTKLNYDVMTLTFKISKKTGMFTSYSKDESFSASYYGVPLFVDVRVVAVETITSMNKSAEATINQKISAAFGI